VDVLNQENQKSYNQIDVGFAAELELKKLIGACNTFNTLLNLSHDLSSSFLMISQGSKELRFLTKV
jgi:hypothetical protein